MHFFFPITLLFHTVLHLILSFISSNSQVYHNMNQNSSITTDYLDMKFILHPIKKKKFTLHHICLMECICVLPFSIFSMMFATCHLYNYKLLKKSSLICLHENKSKKGLPDVFVGMLNPCQFPRHSHCPLGYLINFLCVPCASSCSPCRPSTV